MSGVLVAAAVIGGAASVYSANKQSKAIKQQVAAQREATQAQSRSANVQSARDRMSQIREARIRAAAIASQGGAGGMGQTSSGIAGAISSIGSQTASNIGAINVTQGFAETASNAMQTAADQGVKAQRWQAIGQISSQVASTAFSQAGGFTTIFGGNTINKAGG